MSPRRFLVLFSSIIVSSSSFTLHRVTPVFIRAPSYQNPTYAAAMSSSMLSDSLIGSESQTSYGDSQEYEPADMPMKEDSYEPPKYQPQKYQPPMMNYQPPKYEQMKYEPPKYEQMKYEPPKYEKPKQSYEESYEQTYEPPMQQQYQEMEEDTDYKPEPPKPYMPMMRPMMMPMMNYRPAMRSPPAAAMQSSSSMQLPMMMPMPLTTAMHNQFMKIQDMMSKMPNPLAMLAMPMQNMMQSNTQSMSPCGASNSQPMGGGGLGGAGGKQIMDMLQTLSPMNMINNLQSMLKNMQSTGMGVFGMMNSGQQNSMARPMGCGGGDR